jgi:aminomethyltransferase
MTAPTDTPLTRTPLHVRHVALGARMTPFAGWEMPLEYAGLAAEHVAVRTRAGVFDLSHMGEIEIAGQGALAAVQRVTSNDASRLRMGEAQYSALLTPEGTILDDLVVYRMGPSHFLLVVNAANTARAYAWIASQIADTGAAVVDSSSRYALVGLQGPAALEVLQPLTGVDLADLSPFAFGSGEVAGARVTISRSGYTGEDGFEIFVPPAMADRVWEALLQNGESSGVVPCGLGARDTLRLEAGMRLHGNDIDETTTPLEAGLSGIVGWDKPAFVGRDRLLAQRAEGVTRRLVGFEVLDRGIARQGHAVVAGGQPVGTVTSGTQTPFLKRAIGLAYVPPALVKPGTDLQIDVRGRLVRARVVQLPFYRRSRA